MKIFAARCIKNKAGNRQYHLNVPCKKGKGEEPVIIHTFEDNALRAGEEVAALIKERIPKTESLYWTLAYLDEMSNIVAIAFTPDEVEDFNQGGVLAAALEDPQQQLKNMLFEDDFRLLSYLAAIFQLQKAGMVVNGMLAMRGPDPA